MSEADIPDDLLNELGDRFACLTHSEHGWTAHQWIPNEVIDNSVIAKGDTAADALKKLLEMLAE